MSDALSMIKLLLIGKATTQIKKMLASLITKMIRWKYGGTIWVRVKVGWHFIPLR